MSVLKNCDTSESPARGRRDSIFKKESIIEEFALELDDTSSYYTAHQDDHHIHFTETIQQTETVALDPREISHFVLTWTNICYVVKVKKTLTSFATDLVRSFVSCLVNSCSRKKSWVAFEDNHESITILNNVCGSIKSGQLTAVMGASGAGKTSLLNCISRRQVKGYTGRISTSHPNERRLKVSVIPQTDNVMGTLTVEENLNIASRLKNPDNGFNHSENVESVVKLLNLDEVLHTMSSRLSGGQTKRLLIAQELLSNPDILIMDEPTSGLDSLTCFKTISVLKNIVSLSQRQLLKPIAIVITIHQPHEDVFQMFDKVYCLAKGGLEIFDGPPSGCKDFLEKNSGLLMPDNYNTASFLIEFSMIEYGIKTIRSLNDKVRLEFNSKKTTYDSKTNLPNSSCSFRKVGYQERDRRIGCNLEVDERLKRMIMFKGKHLRYETGILIKREIRSYINSSTVLLLRLLYHIVSPIGIAMLASKSAGKVDGCLNYEPKINLSKILNDQSYIDTASGLSDTRMLASENAGMYFFVAHSMVSMTVATSCLTMALSASRISKEVVNNWYAVASFYISKAIIEIPIVLLFTSLSVIIFYFYTGQTESEFQYRALLCCLSFGLATVISHSIGFIFGLHFNNDIQTGLFMSQTIISLTVLVSGFAKKQSEMGPLSTFIGWLFFYKPSMNIALVARYGFGLCGSCNDTFITTNKVEMIGVSQKLKDFTNYWMIQRSEEVDDPSNQEEDLFQLFAQQISNANTVGFSVNTCKDLVPISLRIMRLGDSDLLFNLSLLIVLTILHEILLVLVFKYKVSKY